jgi:hypothetical protein
MVELTGHEKSITELVRACGPINFMEINTVLRNSILPMAVLAALVNAQEAGFITLRDGRYVYSATNPKRLWCVSICVKVEAETEVEAVDKVLKEYAPLFAD